MKWYLITAVTCLCLSGCTTKTQGLNQTTTEQQDDEAWQGPGYYKGVWIQTETEYNDWRYRHRMPKAPPKPLSPSSAKSRP